MQNEIIDLPTYHVIWLPILAVFAMMSVFIFALEGRLYRC